MPPTAAIPTATATMGTDPTANIRPGRRRRTRGMSSNPDRRPARVRTALLLAAAALTAWGGYVHLREWLDFYRKLPADIPGSAVVRVGFPVNAAISAVLAVLLVVCALRGGRLERYVVGGAFLFQVLSLAALVVTRNGSLFGWSEATWSGAANQARLAEMATMVSLSAAVAIAAVAGRRWPASTNGLTVSRSAVPPSGLVSPPRH